MTDVILDVTGSRHVTPYPAKLITHSSTAWEAGLSVRQRLLEAAEEISQRTAIHGFRKIAAACGFGRVRWKSPITT